MAKTKKQQNHQTKKEKLDERLTLGDSLNQDILLKLKQTQQQLKQEEENQKLYEEEQKRIERRQKEKNKSFEELLNEHPMDWKRFK
ncbi:MAG: YqkE family protein [Heyndrickxia sp.]